MKILTTTASLAKASTLAGEVADLKETRRFAALGAAQIRGVEGGAALVANTLDRMICAPFAAQVEVAGALAVDAERFAKLIDALPRDAEITISDAMKDGAGAASIRSGPRGYKLPIVPADQLPKDLEVVDQTGTVILPRADVLGLFKRTCFATVTSKDARTYLRGVFLHNVGNQLTAVATDSHVLARFGIAAPTVLSKTSNLIVPTPAAELIVKLLAADKTIDSVTLRASKALFSVEAGGLRLVTRLIDGTFPNYEVVVPKAPVGGVTVSRDDLLAATEPREPMRLTVEGLDHFFAILAPIAVKETEAP